MAMNDDTKNKFESYEQDKEFPALEKPKLVKAAVEYVAFEPSGNRRGSRFRIVDEKGKSYGCAYAHLLDWVFDPDGLLTLTTATRIFTFKGKHLAAIEKALMDEKIRALFVFNDKQYKPVTSGRPVIEEMMVQEA